MGQFDARHIGEQRAGKMGEAGGADRCIIEGAGLGLGERDQFRHVFRRQARMDRQHIGGAADHDHRGKIRGRIVRQIGIEAHGECVGAERRDSDGVTVRRRARDGVRPDGAARAGTVVDDDLLAEPHPELLRDDAGGDIGRTAGRERHDHADRLVRPVDHVPGARRSGYGERHKGQHGEPDHGQ